MLQLTISMGFFMKVCDKFLHFIHLPTSFSMVFQTDYMISFSSIQSLSHVQFFTTPCTVACQASLSLTNFQSLLKLMSIEALLPSNHLILCHPLHLLPSIFPDIKVFSNESSGGQSIGATATASVLPVNIQD